MQFEVRTAIGGKQLRAEGVVIASFAQGDAAMIALAALKEGLVHTNHTLINGDTGECILGDVGQLTP